MAPPAVSSKTKIDKNKKKSATIASKNLASTNTSTAKKNVTVADTASSSQYIFTVLPGTKGQNLDSKPAASVSVSTKSSTNKSEKKLVISNIWNDTHVERTKKGWICNWCS